MLPLGFLDSFNLNSSVEVVASPNCRKLRRKDHQPLFQCQIRHNCIKINGLPTVTEDILTVKVNIALSRRGDFLYKHQDFRIQGQFVLVEKPRQNSGMAIVDRICDQSLTLVTDFNIQIRSASEFLFTPDLRDC